MKPSRILLLALSLMSVWTAAVDAAGLRSAPFAPVDTASADGFAHCAVTNGSGTPGTVSANLYGADGSLLLGISNVSLAPHATTTTDYTDYHPSLPTHCECLVPNATTFRCSFVFEGINPTPGFIVIPATP